MQKAFIVVGLAFGDEGKGQTVHNLTQEYDADLIVRYNGGSQAGHNVHTSDGQHHCFSQIGSGSFNLKTKTILSKYMLFDPISFINEANIFDEKLFSKDSITKRVFISENCKIITPFNVISNQVIESLRRNSKHGSCGKGIGDTVQFSIDFPKSTLYAKDFFDRKAFQFKLGEIRQIKAEKINILSDDCNLLNNDMLDLYNKIFSKEYCLNLIAEYENIFKSLNIVSDGWINNEINSSENTIFEGAQGVLLDELYGFHPYTTWSNTTPQNAIKILDDAEFKGEKEILGIIRTYSTRHGAGPFVIENCGFDRTPTTEDNKTNDWQDNFRVGCFDEMMFKYSLDCLGTLNCYPDKIVLTHQDIFEKMEKIPYCKNYQLYYYTKHFIRYDFENEQIHYQQAFSKYLSIERPRNIVYLNKKEFINNVESTSGIEIYK